MERLEVEILARVDGLVESLNAAQSRLQTFGDAAVKAGTAMSAGLTLPILAFGAAAIKTYGDIQALEKGFNAVYKGAGNVGEALQKTIQIAKLPGLGLAEAIQGSVRLQAVGFSAESARKALLAFGNAVATTGGGKGELDRITVQLGQMASKGVVLSQDLRPIIEAAPLVGAALKNMFGTVSSDDISDKLQKAGKSSGQFIQDLTKELSKLPSVQGGIKNALENISDASVLSLSKIGEALNKSFNIEDKINSVSNFISNLATKFSELDPTIQKILFGIAGFVAAAGPLLLVLGLMATTVIPAAVAGVTVLGSALAFIISPIGLVVAALATAVVLIIENWDNVVAYFTTGAGVTTFVALKDLFNSTITFITAIWQDFVVVLKSVWMAWGPTIISITKSIFDILSGIFGIAFTALSGLFKALVDILSGNWSALGTDLLLTTEKIWNGIISIIASVMKGIGALLSKFFEVAGFNDFAKKFQTNLTSALNGLSKSLSFDIPIKPKVDTAAVKKAVTDTNNAIADADNFGSGAAGKAGKRSTDVVPLGKASQTRAIETTNINAHAGDGVNVVANLKESFEAAKTAATEFNEQFLDLLTNGLANGVGNAFEAVGAAMATGGNVVAAFGKSLLASFGEFLGQFGDMLIKYGATALIKSQLDLAILTPGAALFIAPLAIAAGIALKIAAGAFKSLGSNNSGGSNGGGSVRRFAAGGIISGPTLGLMGEYSGARNNPEVVAPLDKLQSMLGLGNNEPQVIIPSVRIGNDAIYIAYTRGAKQQAKV